MKAIIAFCLGLLVTVGAVYSFEQWCKRQISQGKFLVTVGGAIDSVDDLKKKMKHGIFPDPPPEVPVEKRYFTPFDHTQMAIHEFHHFMDKRYHRDSHRHVMKRPDGKLLVEVDFYFDKFGRRLTPANEKKKNTKQFIAMFGDSNILGYGLPQDKTIANFMSEKLPGVKVYNYSNSGIYPYEILSYTNNIDRKTEIPEKEGIGLYFYMGYHLMRNMGGIHELGLPWTHLRKYVDIDEKGEFQVLGTFKQEKPFWFWLAPHLKRSYMINYLHWDLKPRDRDYRIQVALIKKMKKNLEAKGIKRFFVVIHPLQQKHEYTNTLLEYLDKEGIPFIYLAHWQMEHLTEGPITLVFDGHYSANANKVLAEGLTRILKPELQ